MPKSITSSAIIALIAGLTTSSNAQWSNDAASPPVVADGAGEQVQPKIVPTGDGGCYLSWYSSEVGYDVRLQRFDANGNAMWGHNGILIADRNFSSTEDYDLDIDTAGNAVLVFRDDRFSGVQVTAQSIAPDGTLRWGPNGVQVPGVVDAHSPDVATTDDGDAVVAWIEGSNTALVRLDSNGAAEWSSTLEDDAGQSILVSSMHRSDNGSVIISWIQYGFFLGPKHLYAQKIDSAGNEAWANRQPVFDGGSIQFGTFPDFESDNAGGAVFSWYDTANSLNVYVQRLNATGDEIYPHNGIAASTNPRERVEPSATIDESGAIYVAWTELTNNQGNRGIYLQRISEEGDRLFTDEGLEISPINPTESSNARVNMLNNNVVVTWIEAQSGVGTDQILAQSISQDFDIVFPTTEVASVPSERGRLVTTQNADNSIVAVWQNGPFGSADLEANQLNSDGTLGSNMPSCPADLTGESDLNFLDVSAFLSAFGSQDPIADFTNDGNFNFLDVSAFLTAFSNGCP